MTLLARIGLYLGGAVLLLGGAFGAGYHVAAVRWSAKLATEQAVWASREATYQQNEKTAAENLAAERVKSATLVAAVNDLQTATAKANAAAAASRTEADGYVRQILDLMAAQDAQPPPTQCQAAFVQLGEDLAAINGRLP